VKISSPGNLIIANSR